MNYRTFEDLLEDYKSGSMDKRGNSPRFRALYGNSFQVIKSYIEALLNRKFDYFRITIVSRSDVPIDEQKRIDNELLDREKGDFEKTFWRRWEEARLPLSSEYEWIKIILKETDPIPETDSFMKRHQTLLKYDFIGVKTLEKMFQGLKFLGDFEYEGEEYAVEYMRQQRYPAMLLPVYSDENIYSSKKLNERLVEEVERVMFLFGQSPQQELLEWPIEQLDFGCHAYSVLKYENINTVRDLTSKTLDEIRSTRKFSGKTCEEIEDRIHSFGLLFRNEDNEYSATVSIKPPKVRVLEKSIFELNFDLDHEILSELEQAGIKTINDLVHYTELDLKKIYGLGPMRIKHISDKLRLIGMGLKNETLEPSAVKEEKRDEVNSTQQINEETIIYPRKNCMDRPSLDLNKVPIEELDLSVRTFNCIKRAGINTVGDIVKKDDRWNYARSVSPKSTQEVLNKFEKLGIGFESEESKD